MAIPLPSRWLLSKSITFTLFTCFTAAHAQIPSPAELPRLESKITRDTLFIRDSTHTFQALSLLNFHFSSLPPAFVSKVTPKLNPAFTQTKEAIELRQKIALANQVPVGTNMQGVVLFMDRQWQSLNSLLAAKPLWLIDFWASWCLPCRDNAPVLVELYEKYQARGLGIISISADRDTLSWQKAIVQDGIGRWHHAIDTSTSTLQQRFGVYAIPAYILLGSDGKIIGRYNGRWKGLSDMDAMISKQLQVPAGNK